MHNLPANIRRISIVLKVAFENDLLSDDNFQPYRFKPKATDIEILAMNITQKACGIVSQNHFYKCLESDYPDYFRHLPDRANYNKRSNRLAHYLDLASQIISEQIPQNSDSFVIDAINLPVCRFARANRLRILKDQIDFEPKVGYSAIDKQFFKGYKLNLVISTSGVPYSYTVTQGNVHDVRSLLPLGSTLPSNCRLIGDKGYVAHDVQLSLFSTNTIRIITPPKSNTKQKSIWKSQYGKERRRIETLFSQLCDQMRIKTNYAKSMRGYLANISASLATVVTLQFINHLAGRSLNKLKDALAT
jgi:Transposase DDE domain